MKFFQTQPKKCSICGTTENITKHAKPFFHYCEKCWQENYQKILPKVLQQIEEAKQTGKKIDINQAKEYSKQLAKQL